MFVFILIFFPNQKHPLLMFLHFLPEQTLVNLQQCDFLEFLENFFTEHFLNLLIIIFFPFQYDLILVTLQPFFVTQCFLQIVHFFSFNNNKSMFFY